jgi:HK97 family phage portal protein
MGLIDNFRALFNTNPDKATKAFEGEGNFTGQPQWGDFTHLAKSDNYLQQYFGWTYKAVDIKAKSLSSYQPKLINTQGKEEKEIDRNTDTLLKDLYRFNGFQTFTEARKLTFTHKFLSGVAFWLISASKIKGHKFEFYILNPQKMTVRVDSRGLPIGYRYTEPSGNQIELNEQDVIVFRDPDPENYLQGYSPLRATRYQHNILELALKYDMNMFGNMGRPDGFLIFEGVSDDERKRVENALRVKYSGVNNSKRTGILNKAATWLEISKTQQDLDFVEGLKLMRDDLLSIQGVPKPLVGLSDSTFNNSSEAQRIFQQYTLKPELDWEIGVYNEQLLPKYYAGLQPKGLEFRAENPVEKDAVEETNKVVSLYNAGITTRNEARLEVGFEAQEGGDELKPTNTNPFSNFDPNALKEVKDSVLEVKKTVEVNTKKIEGLPDIQDQIQSKREELKKYFEKKNLEGEAKLVEVAKRHFNLQSERMIKAVKKKSKAINLDVDWIKEDNITVNVFADVFDSLSRYFNGVANEVTGGDIPLSNEAMKKLKDSLAYFADKINETTKEDLENLIKKHLESGGNITDLTKKIGDLFGGYASENGRAETIARTETNGIKNMVERDNYARNQFVTGFEWLTARDSYVREAHQQADGQVVPKGVKFLVDGERLEYPGDRSGKASNTINCRCTVLPIVS